MNLDEMERLTAAATPGPWRWTPFTAANYGLVGGDNYVLEAGRYAPPLYVSTPDAAFIAAARTAVPELMAEVRRLRDVPQAVSDLRFAEPAQGDLWDCGYAAALQNLREAIHGELAF